MKKFFAVLLVISAAAFSVYAEKKASAKVVSVSGSVTYEASPDTWADVKPGMEILADSTINTGLNSSVTFTFEGKDVTVKPMKKGRVSDFAANSATKSGVKLGSRVTSKDIASASEKSSKAVVTASSRASEAKEDLDWDE